MSGRRLLMTLALVMCVAARGQHAHEHDEDEELPMGFKDILQRLIRGSRENLRPLKTSRIQMNPSMDYWYEVSDTLPGAKICRIYEHPEMVYRCEWKQEKGVPAPATYAKLVAELKEALGTTDWTLESTQTRASFRPVESTRNPLMEVRIAGTARAPVVEFTCFPVRRWQ